MAAGLDVLASVNITRVAQQIVDVTTLPQPLLWLNRTAKIQAGDDEITARLKFNIYAADIITEDAQALTRDSGQVSFETNQIAKIKHGFNITESQAKTLMKIEKHQGSKVEEFTFAGYIARNTAALIKGIQQREEGMLIGMLLDGYTYDRLGMKVSGSYGMPSDLKITPSTADWDSTSGTPISDMIGVKAYALRTYGEVYDRVTMSYQALQYIIETTEFKSIFKALNFFFSVDSAAIPTTDPLHYSSVVGRMIGMDIEIYEGRFREYAADGTENSTTRFQPEEKVIFTNKADDNSSSGWDFAQGEIIESLFANFGNTNVIGGRVLEGYGPVAYTVINGNLNPPSLTVWAVDRGAPRKLRPTCSAYITAYSP